MYKKTNNMDFFVEKLYNMSIETNHKKKGNRIKCDVKLYKGGMYMGIQEPKFDLHEMQMYFEQEIHNVRTLSDLELSENDYRRLGIKLKSLFAFANNSNFADDFMLCMAVYWTYNFIYWDEKYAKMNHELFQSFEDLSQYTQRHQLDMFQECFHDFGLNSYQVQTGDLLKNCERIVARHAGIPYDEQVVMFDLVNRYIEVDSDTALRSMIPFLPKKTRHIMTYMDRQMKLEVIEEIQKLAIAVGDIPVTKEELMKEFPDTSSVLITNYLYWHESQLLKTCTI